MTQTYPFAVSSDEFKSKRVLVTGGTKGMGEATCVALIERCAGRNDGTLPLPQGQNHPCSCKQTSALQTVSGRLSTASSRSGMGWIFS